SSDLILVRWCHTMENIKKEKSFSVQELINERKKTKSISRFLEKMVPYFLKVITAISILTTGMIIFTLLTETVSFFKHVSVIDFFLGATLIPLSQQPEFGILPLVVATFSSIILALTVAALIGLL